MSVIWTDFVSHFDYVTAMPSNQVSSRPTLFGDCLGTGCGFPIQTGFLSQIDFVNGSCVVNPPLADAHLLKGLMVDIPRYLKSLETSKPLT